MCAARRCNIAIKIGSISISLSAETASFNAGMEKAAAVALNTSRGIERSFNLMAGAITAATGSATAALGLLIKKTEDTVFGMQKMAAQTGISMESFSKMAYAAKVAGMPVDQMATIMTRISRSSFEAASGNKQAANAYKALGVSVTDVNGHFKTADQIAVDVSRSLIGFKDSAAKTAIEMMVMGRSGAEAADFMTLLATRFDETSKTAEKLGLVLTKDTAASARKLHESLINIEEAGLGLSVRLLSTLSPALDDIASKITAFASSADSMHKVEVIGDDLATTLHGTAEAVGFLADHMAQVKLAVEGLLAIRAVGFFAPMIASAAEATGFMGKLGTASLNLTGNLLGVRRLGSVLGPVASSTKGYATAVASLAREESAAGAASIVLSDGLTAVGRSAGLISFGGIVAGLAVVGNEMKAIYDLNEELSAEGKHWIDVWSDLTEKFNTRLMGTKNILLDLIPGLGDITAATEAMNDEKADLWGRKNISGKPTAPDVPDGYDWKSGFVGGPPQKNLSALPDDKPDQLGQKLAELKAKAEAAQRALALVGATPQQQRDSEILEKYNLFLAEEKDHLDKLTPAKRAAAQASAHDSIAMITNMDSAKEYETAIFVLSQTLQASRQEHESMAAAIGKSAKAMQDAAINAKVAQEMVRTAGSGWQNDPNRRLDAEMLASEYRGQANEENRFNDNKALSGIQLEIDAQGRLNAAIMDGAEARRKAALASEQAAIRADFINRADTDEGALQKQLDLANQRSEQQKRASDLERASALDVAGRYREQMQAIQDAVTAAREYGHVIDYRAVLAANRDAWLQFQEAQDKAVLATGGMMDGLKVALDQLARDSESTAQMMHDAFMHAVDSMNGAIANVMTQKHQRGDHFIRNQFSGAFRSIGGDLAKDGLKKAESGVLKSLGMGKADGSSQNPFWVKIAGGLKGAGESTLKGLGDLFHHSDSSSSSSTSGGGWLHSVLGAVFSALPKFADGTDAMTAGMPSIVGEKGPELFVPPSAGAIVPNSKLRNGLGGGHEIHIDARGSTDPAQTVALIDGYMRQAAPKLIQATAKHIHENQVRGPSRRT